MTLREALPWVLGAIATIALVVLYLWWTEPPENTLPEVYEVL